MCIYNWVNTKYPNYYTILLVLQENKTIIIANSVNVVVYIVSSKLFNKNQLDYMYLPEDKTIV